MALTQRLELKQGQSLVMTPLLQQSIKLLQLSNVELTAFVEAELEKNPLLERAPVPDEQLPDAMEPNGLAEPGPAPQETPLPDGFGGKRSLRATQIRMASLMMPRRTAHLCQLVPV